MSESERTGARYTQIVDNIRDRIQRGDLVEGDAVPSARSLMEEYNVARGTADKAIAALRAEGLVDSRPQSGTFVAKQTTAAGTQARLVKAARSGRIYGPGERAVIKSSELVEAREQVAAALGVAVGDLVVERKRITLRDDSPVSVSTSWLPKAAADAAPLILTTERIKEGTVAHVEQATGWRYAKGTEQVTARSATQEEAEQLGVPQGSPVVSRRCWIIGENGEVIEYGESVAEEGRQSTYTWTVD